jgi:thymidylate kinase
LVSSAAGAGDWQRVRHMLPILRRELLHSRNTKGECPVSAFSRQINRWARPQNGLHVVFLGPDGVGKSTVIETFQRDLSPAFLRTAYMTFAPSLIPAKLAPKKSVPHELPPRSRPASLVKAAWWLACYTVGYFASVHTIVSRGGLVVNHRYLIDAIVDQKRYRYSGPVGLLRAIWAVSPKPDMILLLDAPPHVIRKRKSELPLDEIARQRESYRRVVMPLSYGHVIDASQPREKVISDVEDLVLEHLRSRTRRQMNLGEKS